MGLYSPIGNTFGVRVEQLLETSSDYDKYHAKLNKKLQKIRHRLDLVVKDTKRYSSKHKYGDISQEDFNKNPLFAALFLVHSERDLAFVESIKLKARERGKLKKSESKLLTTRLKKIQKYNDKLLELTKDEKYWSTRLQYLIFSSLSTVEYLVFGKHAKRKESQKISTNLAFSFAGLSLLHDKKLLHSSVIENIKARYEYTLKQHASNVISSIDIQNFINSTIANARDSSKDNEIVKLLIDNGYQISQTLKGTNQENVSTTTKIPTSINWRAFVAKIGDIEVAELIHAAKSIKSKNVTAYEEQLNKWQAALAKHNHYIDNKDEHLDAMDVDDEDNDEYDQILLAYIKYHILLASILRDNYLFIQLMKQWYGMISSGSASFSSKLNKYNEIERIVKNLSKFLQDTMEVPGIYSDDDLLAELELMKTYYNSTLASSCLAQLYQTKGKYLDSLALHVHAQHELKDKLHIVGELNQIILSKDILSKHKIETLQNSIVSSWNSVIALAEYEKKMNAQDYSSKFDPTVIEKVSANKQINPQDVKLKNLFPMRPKVRPVSAKPTLFDLAFNYLSYEDEPASKGHVEQPKQEQPKVEEQAPKQRKFLGIFGRS